MQFHVLKSSSFLPALFFVCNGSRFEPYKDSYNKTRLTHEKHHIQDNLGSRYQMMKDRLGYGDEKGLGQKWVKTLERKWKKMEDIDWEVLRNGRKSRHLEEVPR